jgi:hypothetical protein
LLLFTEQLGGAIACVQLYIGCIYQHTAFKAGEALGKQESNDGCKASGTNTLVAALTQLLSIDCDLHFLTVLGPQTALSDEPDPSRWDTIRGNVRPALGGPFSA